MESDSKLSSSSSKKTSSATLSRKDQHIEICLNEDVGPAHHRSPWDIFCIDGDSLPEINFSDVDTSCIFLGKRLKAPLIIGAMTGGTSRSKLINKNLALAAEKMGIGLALGSQRFLLEGLSQNQRDDASAENLRLEAPHLPLLLGNLGAVQLNYGVSPQQIIEIIKLTSCDGFFLHLNALQEAIQPEGNTNFTQLIPKIQELMSLSPVPILLKEVGQGFSVTTLEKIQKLNIHGLELAGLGGTSWSKIEAYRSQNSLQRHLGMTFADWGHTTLESLLWATEVLGPEVPLIASGGIRTGRQGAIALRLGAHMIAMAKPFLEAGEHSVDAVCQVIETFVAELKLVCFLTGSRSLQELRQKRIYKRCP